MNAAGGSREVILVRHAHAERPDDDGRDFDRPLTERGENDARDAGRAIGGNGHRPALVLASPARRTHQTAQIICAELGLPGEVLCLVDSLYNASGATIAAELRRRLAQGTGPLMLVAHNPGISDAARQLAADPHARSFAPAEWRVFRVIATRAAR